MSIQRHGPRTWEHDGPIPVPLIVGPLSLDYHTHRLARDGRPVKLSPVQFAIMEFFMKRAGRAQTNEQIHQAVFGHRTDPLGDSGIRVHIWAIRKKIGPGLITNVFGYGYTLADRAPAGGAPGGEMLEQTVIIPVSHDECFAVLGIAEGAELDLSPNDSGNWTGGSVGAGRLTGSRYGISSATYPLIDKMKLTADGARAIYLRDFWNFNHCEELPPRLHYLVYSCAVNSGSGNAGRWLQLAIGAQGLEYGGLDGSIGPKTIAGALHANVGALLREISAQRLFTVSQAQVFDEDRLGLSRRIINDAATAAGAA